MSKEIVEPTIPVPEIDVEPSFIDAGVIVATPEVNDVTVTEFDTKLCDSHAAIFVAFAVITVPIDKFKPVTDH